jgi:hypothetical protein
MTCRTIRLTSVPAVIEHRVEASKRWESLYVRRRMTDRAYLTRISLFEFRGVTRSTRYMSRHFRRRAVAASHMADETRHPRVLLSIVSKARKILGRSLSNLVVSERSRWFAGVGEDYRETHDEQRSAGRYRPELRDTWLFDSVSHV